MGGTILSEPAKSNRALPLSLPPLAAVSEAGLDGCALVLPPILALVPHGAAPLAGLAGLCAAGLLASTRPPRWATVGFPAVILALLVGWGGLSAFWSVDPWRSLLIDARLAGLFAAALALAAAADRLAAPHRLAALLLAGSAIGIAVALADLASGGGLSRFVSVRPFGAPRLNQISVWLALLALPTGALLARRGQPLAAIAAAAAMAATVGALEGTAAKFALALSLPIAALLYFRRRLVARAAAAVTVIAILTSPLTLPSLAQLPGVFETADAFKDSAGHRLLIWSFTGDRIAEKPFAGWGLDAARAIPGGKDEIRPGQNWLPLHTHDAALQVWLELGAPGAALFALLVGWLWLRVGDAGCPPLYAAAAGGSFGAALAVALAGWGIWQEWWLGTLGVAALAILAMARATAAPAPTRPPPRRGSPASGR